MITDSYGRTIDKVVQKADLMASLLTDVKNVEEFQSEQAVAQTNWLAEIARLIALLDSNLTQEIRAVGNTVERCCEAVRPTGTTKIDPSEADEGREETHSVMDRTRDMMDSINKTLMMGFVGLNDRLVDISSALSECCPGDKPSFDNPSTAIPSSTAPHGSTSVAPRYPGGGSSLPYTPPSTTIVPSLPAPPIVLPPGASGGSGGPGGPGGAGASPMFPDDLANMSHTLTGVQASLAMMSKVLDHFVHGLGIDVMDAFRHVVKGSQEFITNARMASFETREWGQDTQEVARQWVSIGKVVDETGYDRWKVLEIYQREMQKGLTLENKMMEVNGKLQNVLTKRSIKDQQRLTKTAVQTAFMIGSSADETSAMFSEWQRQLALSNLELAQMSDSLKGIAHTTGVSGDNLLHAAKSASAIVKELRKTGALSVTGMANVTQMMTLFQKYGVEEFGSSLTTALSSWEKFNQAPPQLRALIKQAAEATGTMDKVYSGAALSSRKTANTLLKGIEGQLMNYLGQFGISDLKELPGLLRKLDLGMAGPGYGDSTDQAILAGQMRNFLQRKGIGPGEIDGLTKMIEENKAPSEKLVEMEEKRKSIAAAGGTTVGVDKAIEELKQVMVQERFNTFASELGHTGSRQEALLQANAALQQEGQAPMSEAELNATTLNMVQGLRKRAGDAGIEKQLTSSLNEQGYESFDKLYQAMTNDNNLIASQASEVYRSLLNQVEVQGKVSQDPVMEIRQLLLKTNEYLATIAQSWLWKLNAQTLIGVIAAAIAMKGASTGLSILNGVRNLFGGGPGAATSAASSAASAAGGAGGTGAAGTAAGGGFMAWLARMSGKVVPGAATAQSAVTAASAAGTASKGALALEAARGFSGGKGMLGGLGKLPLIGAAIDAGLRLWDAKSVEQDISLSRDQKNQIHAGNAGGFLAGTAGGLAGAKLGGMGGAAIGTAILPGIGTAIGGAIGAIGGGLIGYFGGSKFGKWVGENLYEPLKNALAPIGGVISSIFGGAWKIGKSILGVFGSIFGLVGKIASPIIGLIGKVLSPITSFFSTIGGYLSGMLGGLASWIETGANAVSGFIDGMGGFIENLGISSVVEGVSSVFGGLVSVGKKVINFFKPAAGFVATLVSPLGMVTKLFSNAGPVISGAVAPISSIFNGIMSFVSPFVGFLAKMSPLGMVVGLFSKLGDAMKGVSNFFSGLWSSITGFLGLVRDGIGGIFGSVKDFISNVVAGITGLIGGAIGMVGDMAKTAMDKVKGVYDSSVQKVAETVFTSKEEKKRTETLDKKVQEAQQQQMKDGTFYAHNDPRNPMREAWANMRSNEERVSKGVEVLHSQTETGNATNFSQNARAVLSEVLSQEKRYGISGVDQWTETIKAIEKAQQKLHIQLDPETQRSLELLKGKSEKEYMQTQVRRDLMEKSNWIVGKNTTKAEFDAKTAEILAQRLEAAGLNQDGTKKSEEMAEKALHPGSIYTHDIHIEKIMGQVLALMSGQAKETEVDTVLKELAIGDTSKGMASPDMLGAFAAGETKEAMMDALQMSMGVVELQSGGADDRIGPAHFPATRTQPMSRGIAPAFASGPVITPMVAAPAPGVLVPATAKSTTVERNPMQRTIDQTLATMERVAGPALTSIAGPALAPLAAIYGGGNTLGRTLVGAPAAANANANAYGAAGAPGMARAYGAAGDPGFANAYGAPGAAGAPGVAVAYGLGSPGAPGFANAYGAPGIANAYGFGGPGAAGDPGFANAYGATGATLVETNQILSLIAETMIESLGSKTESTTLADETLASVLQTRFDERSRSMVANSTLSNVGAFERKAVTEAMMDASQVHQSELALSSVQKLDETLTTSRGGAGYVRGQAMAAGQVREDATRTSDSAYSVVSDTILRGLTTAITSTVAGGRVFSTVANTMGRAVSDQMSSSVSRSDAFSTFGETIGRSVSSQMDSATRTSESAIKSVYEALTGASKDSATQSATTIDRLRSAQDDQITSTARHVASMQSMGLFAHDQYKDAQFTANDVTSGTLMLLAGGAPAMPEAGRGGRVDELSRMTDAVRRASYLSSQAGSTDRTRDLFSSTRTTDIFGKADRTTDTFGASAYSDRDLETIRRFIESSRNVTGIVDTLTSETNRESSTDLNTSADVLRSVINERRGPVFGSPIGLGAFSLDQPKEAMVDAGTVANSILALQAAPMDAPTAMGRAGDTPLQSDLRRRLSEITRYSSASAQNTGLFDLSQAKEAMYEANILNSRTLEASSLSDVNRTSESNLDRRSLTDAFRSASIDRQRDMTRGYSSISETGLFDKTQAREALFEAASHSTRSLEALREQFNTGEFTRSSLNARTLSDVFRSASDERSRDASRSYSSMMQVGLFDRSLGRDAMMGADDVTTGRMGVSALSTSDETLEVQRLKAALDKKRLEESASHATRMINTGLFDYENVKETGRESISSVSAQFGRDLNVAFTAARSGLPKASKGLAGTSKALYLTDDDDYPTLNTYLANAATVNSAPPKGGVSSNLISMEDAEQYVSRAVQGEKPTGASVLIPGLDAIFDYLSSEAAEREERIIKVLEQIRDQKGRTTLIVDQSGAASKDSHKSGLRNWSRDSVKGMWSEAQHGSFAEQTNHTGDVRGGS